MIFRRKWVNRQRFYKVPFGGKFYWEYAGTLTGPNVKIGRRHHSLGLFTYWLPATGAQHTYDIADTIGDTSVRVGVFPKAFEPYEAIDIDMPN